MSDKTILRKVGEITKLPSVPRLYLAISSAMANPNITLEEVSSIIQQDMVMSAKILQLVNSAYFCLPRHIMDISSAVRYLGLNLLKNLTLTCEVFGLFDQSGGNASRVLDSLQHHAILTARIAKGMFSERALGEIAFSAALLHDIGYLIQVNNSSDYFERLTEGPFTYSRSTHDLEKEAFGVSHAEIGAYLLGVWGLPHSIIEAVAFHHTPALVPHERFDVVDAIYVADHMANHLAAKLEGCASHLHEELDVGYLDALGVAEQIPKWWNMAEDAIVQMK